MLWYSANCIPVILPILMPPLYARAYACQLWRTRAASYDASLRSSSFLRWLYAIYLPPARWDYFIDADSRARRCRYVWCALRAVMIRHALRADFRRGVASAEIDRLTSRWSIDFTPFSIPFPPFRHACPRLPFTPSFLLLLMLCLIASSSFLPLSCRRRHLMPIVTISPSYLRHAYADALLLLIRRFD